MWWLLGRVLPSGGNHVVFLDPWVWGDPLKKEMTTNFGILAWEIPWTEEPGRLQSVGSQESDTTEHT